MTDMGTHQDIRIGTLVRGGPATEKYIRQILPHGFESFSLTFRETLEDIRLDELASRVMPEVRKGGAVVSSLAIFGNPLETDNNAALTRAGWESAIDHAADFGCDVVAGFTGRLRGKAIHECIDRFKEVFQPLAERAAKKKVRIAFENCSMGGTWQTGDWNIAHNPAAWELLIDAVPMDNIGLEWEPCHQMVSLIDPMPQLDEWIDRIFHVHGKDATIYWDRIRKYGIHSSVHKEFSLPSVARAVKPFAYHRTPGFGDSDWTAIITTLRVGGVQGSIDIEGWHDPVYRDELEMTGQVHALNHLKNCRGAAYVPNPEV